MRHTGAQDFREKYELLNRYCLARKAQLHSQDIEFILHWTRHSRQKPLKTLNYSSCIIYDYDEDARKVKR